MATQGQSSHAPLTSLAVHWHACKGNVPPPLVVSGGVGKKKSLEMPIIDSFLLLLQGACVVQVDDGFNLPSSSSPSIGKVYVFGGRLVSTRRMINDMYILDLSTLYWTRLSSSSDNPQGSSFLLSPQPRYFHSCDLWNGKLVVFGGMGYATSEKESELCVLSEVVAFDLATQQWDFNFSNNEGTVSNQDNFLPEPRYAHLSSITANSLVIIGGQDMNNRYIESINVFDLQKKTWIISQPFEKLRGSYRSLAIGPKFVVDNHQLDLSSRQQYDKSKDESFPLASSNINLLPTSRKSVDKRGKENRLPIYVYTNYNFTDVKREMEMIKVVETNTGNDDKVEEVEHISMEEQFGPMNGISLPPGLRFPMGAMLGNYLLISGTYLANTSQTFAVWALYLPKMTWTRLDVGLLFATGSWNRGVLWPNQGRLLVFGNRDRDLVTDYNHRQGNFDHVLIVELEAWGIVQPPLESVSRTLINFGLQKLASSVFGTMSYSLSINKQANIHSFGGRGDFEIVCSDGIRLGCDRIILEKRWPWFAQKMQEYISNVQVEARKMNPTKQLTEEMNDLLLFDDVKGEADKSSTSTRLGKLQPRLTPRQLFIGEPSPVVLAMLIFFYTRCICTSIQRHPAIVASLLIVSRVYELADLEKWAKHAAQVSLATDVSAPSGFDGSTPVTSSPISSGILFSFPPLERHRLAVGIYEAATLCGLEALQIRALRTVMAVAKWVQRASVSSIYSANETDSLLGDMNLTPTTGALSRENSSGGGHPMDSLYQTSPTNARVGSPLSRKLSSAARLSSDSFEVGGDVQSNVTRRPSKAERMLGMSAVDSPLTTPTSSNTFNRVSKAEKMLGISSGDSSSTATSGSRKASFDNRSASHSILLNSNHSQPSLAALRRPSAPNTNTSHPPISLLNPRSAFSSTDYGSGNNNNNLSSNRKRFSIFGRNTDLTKVPSPDRLGKSTDLLEETRNSFEHSQSTQSMYRNNINGFPSDGRPISLQRSLSSAGSSYSHTLSSNTINEKDIKRTEKGKGSNLTRLKASNLQPIDTSY